MYVHSPDSVPWIETSNLKIRRLIFDCLSMATQQISEFSLKQKRLRYEQICKTAHRCEIEWHLQIQKRCRFFWGFFFGGIFFVFQSGALFLAICYILEQKPVLCWILELKCSIFTVHWFFRGFSQFFHGVHWFTQSVHRFFHCFH